MKGIRLCVFSLVLVLALVSACGPAATPTPTPTKPPAAAPTTAAPATAPTKPAATPTLAPTAPPKASLPARLEFATHAVGSVFNAIGSGIGKVASERSGMMVAVTPTGGPPAWMPGLNGQGSPDIGIINTFELWQAYSGKIAPAPIPGDTRDKPPYAQANKNLRILMMGTNNRAGFLVKADSPIKTIKDIKGKTFTWGYQAFPANIPVGLAALANAGLTLKDVSEVAVPEVTAGVRALMEGRAEVATAAVGMPIVTEADAKIGVRFLPYSEDSKDVKASQAVMPSGKVDREKPGQSGIKVETPIWSYPISVVGSTFMKDDVAYALVKGWWDYHKDLWPIHEQLNGWAPDNFVQSVATVPFHPGAIKFYKEKGIWKAEHDKMQEELLKGELPFLR